jgi:hypothetical protein
VDDGEDVVDKLEIWVEGKQGFNQEGFIGNEILDQSIGEEDETERNPDMMKRMVLCDESKMELRSAADNDSNTLKKGLRVKLGVVGSVLDQYWEVGDDGQQTNLDLEIGRGFAELDSMMMRSGNVMGVGDPRYELMIHDRESDWINLKQKMKWCIEVDDHWFSVEAIEINGVLDNGQAFLDELFETEIMEVNMETFQNGGVMWKSEAQIMVEDTCCGNINATVIARVENSQDNFRPDHSCALI